ncbi:hypothetical protein GCM10011415_41640 [Salipiger pallidus]|uniref:Uncharacterized protein n=1 Tax=Salipiger pallidus TaxID=1775170 RepID=A0A8J2ZNS6_9RHOB|nr:hypothetical protein [Salipiger pallidus]GGG86829.1 hypothetical protein GCM10011415_41640 [Salipiger pallidus]
MRLTICLLPLALLGCAQFPELEAARTPGVAQAPFPDLLPIDSLLAGPAPRATPQMREGIEGRVEGLRARAARLQGPVVPASTRTRMQGGVTWPYDEAVDQPG